MASRGPTLELCVLLLCFAQIAYGRLSVFRHEITGMPGVQGHSYVIVSDSDSDGSDIVSDAGSSDSLLGDASFSPITNPFDWLSQQMTIIQALHNNFLLPPATSMSSSDADDMPTMLKHVKCARMKQALGQNNAAEMLFGADSDARDDQDAFAPWQQEPLLASSSEQPMFNTLDMTGGSTASWDANELPLDTAGVMEVDDGNVDDAADPGFGFVGIADDVAEDLVDDGEVTFDVQEDEDNASVVDDDNNDEEEEDDDDDDDDDKQEDDVVFSKMEYDEYGNDGSLGDKAYFLDAEEGRQDVAPQYSYTEGPFRYNDESLAVDDAVLPRQATELEEAAQMNDADAILRWQQTVNQPFPEPPNPPSDSAIFVVLLVSACVMAVAAIGATFRYLAAVSRRAMEDLLEAPLLPKEAAFVEKVQRAADYVDSEGIDTQGALLKAVAK